MSLEDAIRRMERHAVWLRGWLYAVRSDKRLPDPRDTDTPDTRPPSPDVVQGAVVGHYAKLERGEDGIVRGVVVETRTGAKSKRGIGLSMGVFFSGPDDDDKEPDDGEPGEDGAPASRE